MEELTHFIKNNQMRDDETTELKTLIENKENLEQPPNKQKRPDVDETNSTQWKQFSQQLAQAFNIQESHLKPHNWKLIYTKEDIDLCLSKMKLIDYDEKISIFGSLTAYPVSSYLF